MKFLPIFQELFQSNSMMILLIGLILALYIGIKMNDTKKNIVSTVSSFVLYAACELVSNIHTNFMIELILFFAGTIAIGGIIGFLISSFVVKARQRSISSI